MSDMRSKARAGSRRETVTRAGELQVGDVPSQGDPFQR